MAIDKMMLDAVVSGYRFYLDDMKKRNLEGEHFDEVQRLFNRIIELGQECSDINVFYAKMQQEDITVKMSEAYTRALTEESAKSYGDGGSVSSDSQMFEANLDALRNAIKALRDNFESLMAKAQPSERMRILVDNDPQIIIKIIEDMIALAEEPGMTYPKFLRLQIEQGLDKAAEGVTTRQFLENAVQMHKALMSPRLVTEMWEEKLAKYNEVAAQNKFNMVDQHQWSLISDSIERKYKPLSIKKERIFDHFMRIFDTVALWEIAYCPYTPDEIAPWNMMPRPQALEDLLRIQKTAPGLMREYERQLLRYFGLRLKDIVDNEEFMHKIKTNFIDQSQELVEHILTDVYPHCRPFNDLPKDVIDRRVAMHRSERENNPQRNEPYRRLKSYYASKYGEGFMEQYLKELNLLYADSVEVQSDAAPWDWAAFRAHVEGRIPETDLSRIRTEELPPSESPAETDDNAHKGLFSFFKRK